MDKTVQIPATNVRQAFIPETLRPLGYNQGLFATIPGLPLRGL